MVNLVPVYVDKDTGKIIATGNAVPGGGGGTGGDSPLVWTESGNLRILTGFVDNNVLHLVRAANFNPSNLLELVLASFTPTLSATLLPSSMLNWDIPVSGFRVTVTNPDDYPTEYISSVYSITATSGGTISALSTFVAGTPTPLPSGGIDWVQQFDADTTGHIRPSSTTIAGGSVSGVITFNSTTNSTETPYLTSTAPITFSWATPTMSLTLGSLTGLNFLNSYTSVPYTISTTGVTNVSSVCLHGVTTVGGSASNLTNSGTFTFTNPINKDNISESRSVTNTTIFTRPASVTGTQYSAQLSSTVNITTASFTYPTFYTWTESVVVVPVDTNIINGTNFASGVTLLGDRIKTFAGFINNTELVPRAFWFAVKTSASQPTVFKTGASPSLLSDVAVTMGNSVTLQPSPLPVGYIPVGYTLYGIILQPGNTYVSIS